MQIRGERGNNRFVDKHENLFCVINIVMEKIQSKKQVFSGAATALITPFDKNREVDYEAFEHIVEKQKRAHVSAVVVNGTTGEASCLTFDERIKNVAFVAEKAGGVFPVIAGTGTNCTTQTIEYTIAAAHAGADAVLVVLPYYNNPGEDGIIAHFYAVADASPVPVIAYDVPSRTGMSLTVSAAKKLSLHPNIAGLKEADCSMNKVTAIAAACGNALPVYSGCDGVITPLLAIGGRGVVSVLGNLFPNITRVICDAYFLGDCEKSARLQLLVRPLVGELFAFVSPSPVKAAMAHAGIIENVLRLPLTPIEGADCEVLFDMCDKLFAEEEKCALL